MPWQCYINNEQYINNEHKQLSLPFAASTVPDNRIYCTQFSLFRKKKNDKTKQKSKAIPVTGRGDLYG
jgi:hypothetical protein